MSDVEGSKQIFSMDLDLAAVFSLHENGVEFQCPVCHASVIIVLETDEIHQYKRPPGIYCSESDGHLFIMIEKRPQNHHEFWDQFSELANNLSP